MTAKIGAATVVLVILRLVLVVALVLGAAAALTHYVALPEPLGTLTWIIAGGYSAFVIGVTGLILIALADTRAAQKTARRRFR